MRVCCWRRLFALENKANVKPLSLIGFSVSISLLYIHQKSVFPVRSLSSQFFHLQLFPNERRIFSPSFSLPFPPTIKATSKEYKKCQCAIRIFELCMFDEKLLLRIIKLKVIWDIRACVCVRARVRCEFFQLCRVIKKKTTTTMTTTTTKKILFAVFIHIFIWFIVSHKEKKIN